MVLFVAADVAARNYASSKIEGGLASSLELSGRPDVTIGGFPFLIEAVRGRLDEISISADSLRGESVELSEVALVLRDVRFSLKALFDGKGRVGIRSGDGTAMITRDAIVDALEAQGLDASLAQNVPADQIELAGDRTLALGPTELRLPLALGTMTYEDLEVDDDRIILRFSIARTKIEIDR